MLEECFKSERKDCMRKWSRCYPPVLEADHGLASSNRLSMLRARAHLRRRRRGGPVLENGVRARTCRASV